MEANKNVKIIIPVIALLLAIILFWQLSTAPTFLLPPIYMAIMVVVAIIIAGLVIAGVTNFFIKKSSFYLLFFTSVCILCGISIYKFYSPTLTITVPKGYVGQITLVLSNVKENELTVDSNGIGYVTSWTFNKTYTKPIVKEVDGTDITYRIVGYNPSAFWGKGTFSHLDENSKNKTIKFKLFEVVPSDKAGEKQYYNTKLSEHVDKSKL